MFWTVLNFFGGIKTALLAVGGLVAGAYLWWVNRSRTKYKDEAEAWRKVQEVRKQDEQVDKTIEAEVGRVDAAPDSGLDAELDRVRDYSKARNAKGR